MESLFVGNHIAVDFVNTQSFTPTSWRDSFVDSGALKNWLVLANCAENITCSPRELRNAVELRRSLKRIFERIISNDIVENSDLANLNAWSNRLMQNVSFDKGDFKITAIVESGDDALAKIARSACELIASSRVKTLRQCASKRCWIFFVDTSKNQRRRWCSKELCGNRTKVLRAYYRFTTRANPL